MSAAPAVVVGLLAVAALAYLNGAVLDPLQFRGFPDYVTQMRGARKLLVGALPYDPTIRVWTDVNLPPITLLLLFAPFTVFSELAGRLAYFALNHLTFLAGVALLVWERRPPAARMPGALWVALVALLALTYEPWHDSLRLGQQNGVVLFFLAVAAVCTARRRDVLAGAALALALIGKPSSALIGLYFLFAGRWRAAIAAAVTGALAFAVTLPWIGVETWRFYLLEKAPELFAGTPQQSNVALLAYHARLFLPLESLASFDAMPDVPLAVSLTRVAQLLGAWGLWRLVRRTGRRDDATGRYLELSVALALSLSLVGHAWQSYTTWLIVAFAALADPAVWDGLTRAQGRDGAGYGERRLRAAWPLWTVAGLAALSYACLAVNDVTLHRVVGSTSATAAVFAALPSFALLALAYVLALLAVARDVELATLIPDRGLSLQ